MRLQVLVLIVCAAAAACRPAEPSMSKRFTYPTPRKSDLVEDYGTKVPDPRVFETRLRAGQTRGQTV